MTTTMIALGALIVGVLLALVICYFLPKEKVRTTNQALNEKEHLLELQIKDKEKELTELINKFSQERIKQQEEMRDWETEQNNKNFSFLKAEMNLKESIAGLESQIEEKKKSISTLDAQSTEAIKSLEQRTYDLMVEELAQQSNSEIEKMRDYAKQARAAYAQMMQELMDTYQLQTQENSEKYQQLLAQIEEATAKSNAIIEANKRAELDKEEKDFFRLQLSDIDIEEISKIRSIEPYLRKAEPLNKVIWKVYYEKPYTDLIGRVIGTKKISGIYRITNLKNGKTYVGQAVDVAERWRQHIKRGIGADPPTQNKLYPAMLEDGVENFTFEVLEICQAAQLTEREKYYTDVFQANSYGYVVRKG